MSYTLKKLKQSEIDHGYRKPPVNNNKKIEPSYGLFVACFTIILAVSLVLVKGGEDFFSQLPFTSTNQVSAPFKEEPVSIASKNVSEHIPDNSSLIKQKNTRIEEKHINDDINTVISANNTRVIVSVPSIISEPHLYNPDADGNFFETQTNNQQDSEKNSSEKSEQLINLATYASKQTSSKAKNASLNNKPVLWKELPSDVKSAMPKMNLNGVAFLDNEEDRYIFINMNKYQVGDDVDMGPSVVDIRKNSAIMRFKKRLFILTLHE